MKRKILWLVIVASLMAAVTTALVGSTSTASAKSHPVERGGPNTFWD